LLAAGLGTRLKPLTDKIPKPMLPIGGIPLLEHQINLLKKYNVSKIAINLYHLPDQIQNYFGNGNNFGVSITYIKERRLSGTAGAIKKLSTFFQEPFFVIYGDNLTNIDLSHLYSFHKSKGGLITVSLYYEPHPESKGIVTMDKKNRIMCFKEKPKTEEINSHWANAGIYICEPEIVKLIPRNRYYDFGHDLFPKLLLKGLRIYGYKMNEYLLDIGTTETYAKAQLDIASIN